MFLVLSCLACDFVSYSSCFEVYFIPLLFSLFLFTSRFPRFLNVCSLVALVTDYIHLCLVARLFGASTDLCFSSLLFSLVYGLLCFCISPVIPRSRVFCFHLISTTLQINLRFNTLLALHQP